MSEKAKDYSGAASEPCGLQCYFIRSEYWMPCAKRLAGVVDINERERWIAINLALAYRAGQSDAKVVKP